MSTPSPEHRAESDTPRDDLEPTGPAPESAEPTYRDAPATSEASDDSGGVDDASVRATEDSDTETTAVRRKSFLGLRHDDGTADPDAARPADTDVDAGRDRTAFDGTDRSTRSPDADGPTPAFGTSAGAGAATGATAGTAGAAGAGSTSTGAPITRRFTPTRGSSAVTPDHAGDDAALRERWRDQPEPTTDVLLEGATQAAPRSRAAAHVWGLILSIVLVPIAWYLVADAGARLTLGQDSPWQTGELNLAAVVELVAGLVVVAAVLLLARWSSVGAIVTGIIVLLAGLAFVVVPGPTRELLEPAVEWLRGVNDLGRNTAHHLTQDGPAGRLALYGLALIMVGVVSHGARRLGRAEERAREAYARREQRTARHGNGRG